MPFTFKEIGRLISAKRIMDYRRMNKGVPILVDFKTMVEENAKAVKGDNLSLVVDEGVVRAKLNVSYATYLQNKKIKAAVESDAKKIRAAQDQHMAAKEWWKKAVAPLAADVEHSSAAIPLPIRSMGSPDVEGYDNAVDVGIFEIDQEGKLNLVVIERAELKLCEEEIGKNYALVGGMTVEKAARIPQVVLEFLEEGISNSIATSQFYLDGLDAALQYYRENLPEDEDEDEEVDNLVQKEARRFIGPFNQESSAQDQFKAVLEELNKDESVEGKQNKAKYVIGMLKFVDNHLRTGQKSYSSLSQCIDA